MLKGISQLKLFNLRPGLIIILLLVLLSTCVEPFEPEDPGFKSVLVVDGFISNSAEPYTITLSRTAPLSSPGALPEAGAAVSVADEEGGVYLFGETAPGVYQSDPRVFVGHVGAGYQLNIVTASGEQYQSDTVPLKQSPPIDSVYYERELRLTDVEGEVNDGISIFVDAHDSTGQTRFYRYDYTETYEVKLTYPGEWVYDPSQDANVIRNPKLGLCYATHPGGNILVANTSSYAEDRVKKLEVTYVSTGGYKLSGLYSILVKQYALSEPSYRYWYELQKTSESLGTLFDPQPYEIRGNIRKVNDPETAVLGYFDAGAVSEKMLFVDKVTLLGMDIQYPTDPCIARLGYPPTAVEFGLYQQWGYLITAVEPYVMIPAECGDCRYHGTLEKPAFWPR
ncbi:DUF4249 domain-containing protein [uncultured Imperialibacter sp.]|uniref:DUF4249 domain-containing protein n=1 Tax=uncultured Imperialibacter sp. TaxID=1672639 RepID=UPI0030DD4E7A|tara:strand:+ start:22879 stop:24063 length:1185 start_codon:yes stop_codon:yes gene_type:complete